MISLKKHSNAAFNSSYLNRYHVLLGSICINANISYSTNIIIFICLTLLLLINILTFYLQQDISKKNVEYARLQIELQKENDTVEYYRYIQENNEKQHILIHDIKNHLNTINNLNDGNHTEKYLNILIIFSAAKR